MNNIVDINRDKPYQISEVICVQCHKRYIAVRPENMRLIELECPNACSKGTMIETGEEFQEQWEEDIRNEYKKDNFLYATYDLYDIKDKCRNR